MGLVMYDISRCNRSYLETKPSVSPYLPRGQKIQPYSVERLANQEHTGQRGDETRGFHISTRRKCLTSIRCPFDLVKSSPGTRYFPACRVHVTLWTNFPSRVENTHASVWTCTCRACRDRHRAVGSFGGLACEPAVR